MSMINADENFEKLGLTLPPAPAPAGVYKPCVIDGKYLFYLLMRFLPVYV